MNHNQLILLCADGNEAAANLLDMIDEGSLNPSDTKRIQELYDAHGNAPLTAKRCRYEDCAEHHPVATEDEQVTCATCRASLALDSELPVAFPVIGVLADFISEKVKK